MTKALIGVAAIAFATMLAGHAFADGYHWVDFEGVGEIKTSYAAGTVELGGRAWEMTEALIGTSDADWKNGARSARLRGYGSSAMTLLEDLSNGLSRVQFLYSRYGTDTQREWQTDYSVDGGTNWLPIGEPFAAPSANEVQTFSETVAVSEPVRIRIRAVELSGTSNRRLNLDDILLVAYEPEPVPPVVRTGSVSAIGPDFAIGEGVIVYDGEESVGERGIVLNTAGMPSTNDTVHVFAGDGGVFSVAMTNLSAGKQYFARAFAVNSAGVGYGGEETFYAAGFAAAPVALRPVPMGSRGYRLHWTRVAGAKKYFLDVASAPCFSRGEWSVVFRETFGYVSGETSLETHGINGGFDTAYAFGAGGIELSADLRPTSVSSGYENPAGHPASGWANVYFPRGEGCYGFAISGVAAEPGRKYRLHFGYRKESLAGNADFAVSWSMDSGATWHPLGLNGLPPDNAGTGWRLIRTDAWLVEAGEPVFLALRWVKSGSIAMRIDDVVLEHDGGSDSLLPDYTNRAVYDTRFDIENLESKRNYFRVRAMGADYCVTPHSNVRSFGVSTGTVVLLH